MFNAEGANMNDEHIWKLYKYTCIHNGLIYFGITSKSLEHRWRQGYHHNKRLYADILKYGEQGFVREIVLDKLTRNEVAKEEISHIAEYDTTNPDIGYNIAKGGTAPMYGRKHSAETRKHFSTVRKGEKNSFYGRHHSDKTKEILRQKNTGRKHTDEWKSEQSARSKEWHKTHENPMKGNHRFAGRNNPMYGRTGADCPFSTPVAQLDSNGRVLKIFASMTDASIYLHGSRNSHISDCCRGVREKCMGYKWRFATPDEAVDALKNIYGQEVRYGNKDLEELEESNEKI